VFQRMSRRHLHVPLVSVVAAVVVDTSIVELFPAEPRSGLQTKLTSFAWHSALDSHRSPSILLPSGSGTVNPSTLQTPQAFI